MKEDSRLITKLIEFSNVKKVYRYKYEDILQTYPENGLKDGLVNRKEWLSIYYRYKIFIIFYQYIVKRRRLTNEYKSRRNA